MKKHFYLLPAFLLIAFASQAQFKTGQILLGGNVGFSSQKSTPVSLAGSSQVKLKSILLNPSFAQAIKDNELVGFDLNYVYSNNDYLLNPAVSPYTYDLKLHTYGAGFFLRHYKVLGSGFSLFVQGRLGFDYTVQNTDYLTNPDYETKEYDVSLGFYPGISYGISKKVLLETGFQNLIYANYGHQKTTQSSNGGSVTTDNSNNFSLSTSLSNSLSGFVVGFRVLLGS